jgi:ethanolamine utilization protein EutM
MTEDALGMIKKKGLPGGIKNLKLMLNAADIKLARKKSIDGGYVTVFIRGNLDTVQSTVKSGCFN